MKPWRIGIWTIAAGCFATAAFILLHSWFGVTSIVGLRLLWPILLIVLGTEIIWNRYRSPKVHTRVNGWAIAIVVVAFLAYLANVGVTRVMTVMAHFHVTSLSALAHPSLTFLAPVRGEVTVSSGIRAVHIQIPNGGVTISPSHNQDLTYSGQIAIFANTQSAANDFVKAHWSVTKHGDTLEITLIQSNHLGLSWNLPESPYLTLSIPATLDTQVRTPFGSIRVSDMKGNTADHAVLGSVFVQNIGGSAVEQTVNGNCTAVHVENGLQTNTVNGSTGFNDVNGAIISNSVNGAITGGSPVSGNWNLNTINGAVNVTLHGTPNVSVQADTGNGGINGNLRWQFSDDGHHHATCVLSNGQQRLALHTMNGGITVNRG